MADTQSSQPPNNKKNILTSIGNAAAGWFGMLTGKGFNKGSNSTASTQNVKEAQPPQEDSVAEDMKKAKAFINQAMAKFNKSAGPTFEKGKQLEGKGVEYAKKVVDVNFSRKIARIFTVLFFGLVLLFVASRFFKLVGNGREVPAVATPTIAPTVPPFQRTEPSIYAQDKLILKIEEDAKVLVNEIIGKTLNEDSLALPSVDANIEFLK